MLALHLWLSVAGGLLVVVLGATGSLLVYGAEIDRALNPALFRASAGDVGPDAILASVAVAYPSAVVTTIATPAATGGVYAASLAGDDALTVYVDPGSGAVLGARDVGRSVVGRVRRFHRELLAGEVGRAAVGIGGLILLAITLTGLYLWWPRWERIRHLGFAIRRGRGSFVLQFDMHKVAGIVSAPVLAAIAYTGVLLVWGELPHRALAWVVGTEAYSEPAPDYVASRPTEGGALPLAEFSEIARRAVPGGVVTSFAVPVAGTDPAAVALRLPGDPLVEGSSKVWLDRSTGAVRARVNAEKLATPDWLFRSWRLGIHAGAYGGAVTRALHAAAGLMPLTLMATGLVLWRRRVRFAREAGRRTRAHRPVAAPGRNLVPEPAEVAVPCFVRTRDVDDAYAE